MRPGSLRRAAAGVWPARVPVQRLRHKVMKFPARALMAVYDWSVFYLCLAEFVLLSLAWSLLASLLHMVLPQPLGQRVGRLGIMLSCRLFLSTLALSGRFHFDLRPLDAMRGEKAMIIAPNHPSLWDAVMMASRLPDVACIMKATILDNLLLGGGARLSRYIPNDSIRAMICLALDNLRAGSHVLLFPEGTRTVTPPIGKITGAVGVIACRAHAPVQTVLVDTNSRFLSKGWPAWRKPDLPLTYTVRLGRRFDAPTSSATLASELQQYFSDALTQPAAAPGAAAGAAAPFDGQPTASTK
ncbi:1-acyl-sn-glycerol-3-phosphate acyltransferase [Noviherbaspirillum suwonense]|uniref:1-acyl-sn-glycerol-3-phosphate acyltransferase n=2 Tax=Noviherbaspirillum suwonense TaxID=1224511 RepID=A0ABY1QK34_9BURK|nr:1-acyl-sn-glycerol-3-phosphate acyltransferase [Noviherbaspirillum suwonense]